MQKRSKVLFNKSVSAVISAIELYNKPDFKYREESFIILLVNGWELLLKAKILQENNNKLVCLYYKKPKINKKGEKTKKLIYVKNRSGSHNTLDLFACIKKLENEGYALDKKCFDNLEAITEIRDNAIHLCNSDKLLNKKIQEFGTASLKNYLVLVKKWFHESLENFNFYLMPISFFNDYGEVDGINLSPKNKEIYNLTRYVAEKEKENPFSRDSEFHVSVKVELKLIKSDTEGATNFRLTKDQNAPKVQLSEEERSKQFPLDYKTIINKIKSEYPLIKIAQRFHSIKAKLEQNPKLCFERYLDPNNKKSSKKKFYNDNFPTLLIEEYAKN